MIVFFAPKTAKCLLIIATSKNNANVKCISRTCYQNQPRRAWGRRRPRYQIINSYFQTLHYPLTLANQTHANQTHSHRFQVSKAPSGLDFAQDESRMIHTTHGSHPIRSIHLLKHSLDPWERHNPNRNALRSVEIQFLNHLRKEISPPKGCLSG